MLSGFNTNIRHRGVLFHVQTEDSGRGNPHVITHLFHGGNIMASRKSDYSAHLALDAEALEDVVRQMMETQHKAMLKGLRAGRHDETIEARLGAELFDADTSEVVSGDDGDDVESTDTAAAPPPAPVLAAAPAAGRGFGEGVLSDKPLDEVVLEYLVENARKRRRSAT